MPFQVQKKTSDSYLPSSYPWTRLGCHGHVGRWRRFERRHARATSDTPKLAGVGRLFSDSMSEPDAPTRYYIKSTDIKNYRDYINFSAWGGQSGADNGSAKYAAGLVQKKVCVSRSMAEVQDPLLPKMLSGKRTMAASWPMLPVVERVSEVCRELYYPATKTQSYPEAHDDLYGDTHEKTGVHIDHKGCSRIAGVSFGEFLPTYKMMSSPDTQKDTHTQKDTGLAIDPKEAQDLQPEYFPAGPYAQQSIPEDDAIPGAAVPSASSGGGLPNPFKQKKRIVPVKYVNTGAASADGEQCTLEDD
ncbi:unnamed protein product [Vitrella brassicaformis CCMP3155]|uniref:Uncharacterized protein n=1 Tax=Vitrella brassicaformis (strain CCMP3155) TaxID=1169540 RepID=A0A0G4FIU5_VITBC|nr:unnamed protein product [Vitrella brassicaformis CCMP3155]|eukprot:CEM13029.1 unnamed protein product [Vitrella brassicaformis CCMP3155]